MTHDCMVAETMWSFSKIHSPMIKSCCWYREATAHPQGFSSQTRSTVGHSARKSFRSSISSQPSRLPQGPEGHLLQTTEPRWRARVPASPWKSPCWTAHGILVGVRTGPGRSCSDQGSLCCSHDCYPTSLQRNHIFWFFKQMALKQPWSICLHYLVGGFDHSMRTLVGNT